LYMIVLRHCRFLVFIRFFVKRRHRSFLEESPIFPKPKVSIKLSCIFLVLLVAEKR
jgi:hypothetical protein